MSSLFLGDLNDYIQPSVACIKPGGEIKSADICEDDKSIKKSVEINLNDCLACSGCITSAETVLVSQQTYQQLCAVVDQNNASSSSKEKKIIVISICPATRTALARRFRLSPCQVHRRLRYFFQRVLGATLLLDAGFAAYISLREAAAEFIKVFRANDPHRLPILASECPGWICYAEKKQPSMLGQICTVRSPQQIMGALAKTYLLEKFANPELPSPKRKDVYHATVMSCYDKKLEAARPDFADKEGIRDVDCVITTTELLAMVEDRFGDFVSLPEDTLPLDDSACFSTWRLNKASPNGLFQYLGHEASSGGGYLFYIMREAAKELFNMELPAKITLDPRVIVNIHRNIDYVEYTLVESHQSKKPLLKFAAIYGFRNIQTFVQKIKARKIEYHYIEVLACPGGCLFGGGQPSVERAVYDIHRLEMERLHADQLILDTVPVEIELVYKWVGEDASRQELFRTGYRALEETNKKNPLINVQW